MFERIRNWARALKRDIYAVYLAGRSPDTPWHLKLLAAAVAAYALSPIDLIPDFIPVLGYLDDLILVPLGIWLVVSLIPDEAMAVYRTRADEIMQRPHDGRIAALVIIAIWLSGASLLGWVVLSRWVR
jgi:uncharacterized membrane protein YkvA (DUF1232 family)